MQFVDIFKRDGGTARVWRGRATIGDLQAAARRASSARRARTPPSRVSSARASGAFTTAVRPTPSIVSYSERQLAGAIGAASARIMVASVLREEMHDIDEVLQILDEASQLVVYSRQLEQKSRELEAATAELRAANERLKELDQLKDDFVATVSHELRTPLTSIRSFSEILRDNPDLDQEQRQEFVSIIVKESERLSRLINDILDLAKMEAGTSEWHMADLAPRAVIEQALAATAGLFAKARHISLETRIAADLPPDPGRCGSAHPGDREPDLERREVLRPDGTAGSSSKPGRMRTSSASTSRTTASASPRPTSRGSSNASSRPAIRSPTSRRAPGLACRFPGRFCSDSAAKSGSKASRARERRSPSVFRSLDRLRRRR